MIGRLGYRLEPGRRVPAWRRFWPLAQGEFASLFQSKWGVAAFCVCLVPGIARLVMLLIVFEVVQFAPGLRSRMQQRSGGVMSRIDPFQVEFYLDPVLSTMPGMVFAMLLTALVAARAIAKDRGTNAIELYWTRGISPRSYVIGKWLGSTLLLGVLTVVVPATLWLVAVLLAEDGSLFFGTWWPMARATLGLTFVTCVWTGIGIQVSCLCARPNAASVLWCTLLIGSHAVGVVASQALREPWLRGCLSLWDSGGILVRSIAGVPQRDASWPVATCLLVGTWLFLFWRARRRMNLVEALG
jgi:ABC-type transport system involved in multi-copper enzyme maturation permease subunit